MNTEEAREARQSVMRALQNDDHILYVGIEATDGEETAFSVVRYGMPEAHAIALATYLSATEGRDVLRLMRQLNDESRPTGIEPWTEADEKIHLRQQMDKISNLDGLPPSIRSAMEGLLRAIEDEAEKEDADGAD